MPNFETFTRRMIPLTKKPYVTIQKRGTISMNKAAFVAMGSPEAVELLFDSVAQIIGFRPVDPSLPHAYAPRGVGSKADSTTYVISAAAFTQYFQIDTTVSRRWEAAIDDGVLCVDLQQPSLEVTSNRTAKATAGN